MSKKCTACGKENCKTKGGWNYRVLGFKTKEGYFYAVHEVYYKGKKPDGYTKNEVSPHGETLKELWSDKELYENAFMLPVLLLDEEGNFTGTEHGAGFLREPNK